MKLDRIFQSHMVLQRDKEIFIYGSGEEGEVITVSFGGQIHREKVTSGQWESTFPPMGAQRGLELRVHSDNGTECFLEDILVGDVYLAGGQSNMEFWMKYDEDYDKEHQNCTNENIRFFDFPEVSYQGQEENFDYFQMGRWRTCDPENLEYFSAVAYYFAKKISAEEQIPVGIVGCNYGGTPAASWMKETYLEKHGKIWLEENNERLKHMPENYWENTKTSPAYRKGDPFADEMSNKLLYGLSREEQLELMKSAPMQELPFIGPCDPGWPGSLYQNMLLPLKRQTFRGVLWYQGESDVFHADLYEEVWKDMIDCWRDLFKEQLPFFAVQLAPFQSWMACDGELFPVIRRAQEKVAREKEGVYLASSSDVGERFDIHPKKKAPIGLRLALLAEKAIYKKEVLCQAPCLESAKLWGSNLTLSFANAGEGLMTQEGTQLPLVLTLTQNGQKEELQIRKWKVSGCNVEITLEKEITGELEIALAQSAYYEMNLKNSAQIPAMPGFCHLQA